MSTGNPELGNSGREKDTQQTSVIDAVVDIASVPNPMDPMGGEKLIRTAAINRAGTIEDLGKIDQTALTKGQRDLYDNRMAQLATLDAAKPNEASQDQLQAVKEFDQISTDDTPSTESIRNIDDSVVSSNNQIGDTQSERASENSTVIDEKAGSYKLDEDTLRILGILNESAKGNIQFSLEVARLAAELKGKESTTDRLKAIQDFIGRHSDELQTEADKTNLRLNKARGISQGFDSVNPDGYDGPSLSALITEDPGNEKGIRDAAVSGMVQDLKFSSRDAAEKTINNMVSKGRIDQDTANRVRSTIREESRSEADKLIERFTRGEIELTELETEAAELGYREGSEFFDLIMASKRDFEDTSERFGTLLSGQNRTDVNKIPYDIFYGRDKTPEELAKMSDKERSDRAVMREVVINQIIEKTLEGLPEPSKSIQREKLLNQSKLNEANRIAVAAEGVALQKEAKAKDFNAFWKKAGLISKYFGPAFLGLGIGGLIALTGNINGAYKLIPLLVGVGVPGLIGGGKYAFGGGLKEWRNIEAEKARAIAGLAAVEPKILAMQGNLAASQEATLGSIAEMAVQAQIAKTGRIVDKRAYDQMLRRAYGLIGYSPESAGRPTKGLFNLAIA